MSSARTGEGSDTWRTPPVVLDRVQRISRIGLDPCASDDPARWFAEQNYNALDNGLGLPWDDFGLVYVNPPYSHMLEWSAAIQQAAHHGSSVIALVPARTDTKWWRKATQEADCVAFWNGRITFAEAPGPAPFPSAVIACNVSQRAMRRAFNDVAIVWSVP